ncbi:MAG: acyl--CoA ligase [Lachnospiraceae bacterium]|nr:acyl--CoA ligase [Lachnospiraceae bacterium]
MTEILPRKTIADNIIERNKDNLWTTALVSLGGASVTYKVLFELIDVYSKAFVELGVDDGDIVTICAAGTLDIVVDFLALNRIGAVVQFVNPNYFKFNSKKYINDTGCNTMVCLDRFYPSIKEEIRETNVKKLIVSSMADYMSLLYRVIISRKRIKQADKYEGIEYHTLSDVLKVAEWSRAQIQEIPYEKEKPSVISYTSGTTGNPKGVVHTNDSINSMISLYDIAGGFGIGKAEKNLVLIPPMYLTSFVHSIYAPMAMGATNILQPIYNPETLGKDLKRYKPKTVVASKAHYINLEKANLPKGSLKDTKYAYCGGEAISKAVATRINNTLNYYGIGPMVLGYGQSEFGTMTMFNFDIKERTNESGILIPTLKAKILDVVTGKEVSTGKRGELYIQSPAVMKEYINNPEATEAFFVTDENGETWARTGDIAEILYQYNGENVYEVSGRRSDSFVDREGNVVYLFDIENIVEEVNGVREAEVIAITIDDRKVPIVHVIPTETEGFDRGSFIRKIDERIKETVVNRNAVPYAYKIRESFSTSPISGKRDYAILQYETEDFICVDGDKISNISIYSEESRHRNDLIFSNIGELTRYKRE